MPTQATLYTSRRYLYGRDGTSANRSGSTDIPRDKIEQFIGVINPNHLIQMYRGSGEN